MLLNNTRETYPGGSVLEWLAMLPHQNQGTGFKLGWVGVYIWTSHVSEGSPASPTGSKMCGFRY